MLELKGDIWDFHDKEEWIAITTNGTIRGDGACVMGRGVALQAKQRYPKIPYQIGKMLGVYGNVPLCLRDVRIATFPVKFHWKDKADLGLIEDSARGLVEDITMLGIDKLYTVRPGCGNGRLHWTREVEPVLKGILDDRFIVVERRIE